MGLPGSLYLWVKNVLPSQLCFGTFPLPDGKQGRENGEEITDDLSSSKWDCL